MTNEEMRSIEPNDFWKLGSFQKRAEFLLRYAILAPSTHNSQPWKFKIKNDSIVVAIDSSVSIREADPLGRDLFISLGACLENLILAAKSFGVYAGHTYFSPESSGEAVAEVRLNNSVHVLSDTELDQLHSMCIRLNARGIFDRTPVDSDAIAILRKVSIQNGIEIKFISNNEAIKKIAAYTGEGIKRAYKNAKFRKEMSAWIHPNTSKRVDGLHGYSLRIPFFISFLVPFIIRYFNLGNLLAKVNNVSLGSVPGIFIFGSKQEDNITWIQIGQLAERIMLELANLGIYHSIFVASIELGFGKEIGYISGMSTKPQFLFAVGRMTNPPPLSPRYSVHKKIYE